MDPWLTILLIVVFGVLALCVAIMIAVWVVMAVVMGALNLLSFAGEYGAVGVGIYIMCWIFAAPVMLVVCTFSGVCILVMWNSEEKARKRPAIAPASGG